MATASDYITQKQLLAHMNIIMKHAPVYMLLCMFGESLSLALAQINMAHVLNNNLHTNTLIEHSVH